jgi:hypothetical protein
MKLLVGAFLSVALSLVVGLTPQTAMAEQKIVTTYQEFLALVRGKTLTRPLIRLQVSEDGQITGRGATWDVEGTWRWQNGYFCRDLYWGGDALGYNCQEVRARGNRIRFTSDKGTGQSAEFRLN